MISATNALDLLKMYDRLISEGKDARLVHLNGLGIICNTPQLNAEIERRRDTTDYRAELRRQIDKVNKTGL